MWHLPVSADNPDCHKGEKVLVADSEKRTEMLLNTLQGTRQCPQQLIICPKISVGLRLGNPAAVGMLSQALSPGPAGSSVTTFLVALTH